MLDTDGMGAVLAQNVDGVERVVAYASRALSRTEKKYCAMRWEMLALVWAARHFRPHLYRRMFTLRTDHYCLLWLHNFKEPEGQVARWLDCYRNMITPLYTAKVSGTLMLMRCPVAGACSVD